MTETTHMQNAQDTQDTQNVCIFCKIIRKEIPSTIVYEDSLFLAFLSIDPRSPGHTLIVPKEHRRWVWDVPQYTEYAQLAQKMALAHRKAFNTEALCSHIEGEEIAHAHIWIYQQPHGVNGKPKDFEMNAQKIREVLAHDTLK